MAPERIKRAVPSAIIMAVALGVLVLAIGAPALSAASRDVDEVWAETCASCHGEKLAGALAESLLDDEWVFGGDDASPRHEHPRGPRGRLACLSLDRRCPRTRSGHS